MTYIGLGTITANKIIARFAQKQSKLFENIVTR